MASEIEQVPPLEAAPQGQEEDLGGADFESRYAPFVRRDVYGRFGRGELPWTEIVLMAFAALTIVPARLVVGATMVLFYYLLCRVCTLFQKPNKDGNQQEDYAHMQGWRRAAIVSTGKFLSRIFLFVLGFYRIDEINLQQPEATGSSADENERKKVHEADGRPGAIISNHISYIDIVYHMSSSFPSFVAKRSVAEVPVVSLISKCLGCIYVRRERESKPGMGVSGVVARRIKEAQENRHIPQLLVFPEGTTTNGDFLLPFKTGAFLPKGPVLPVILRYPYERFSLAWESISAVPHALFLLCQFVNYMEVIRLPVYYPSPEEMKDPRLYARNLRSLMAAEGKLKLSNNGLQEKRAYLSSVSGLFKSD